MHDVAMLAALAYPQFDPVAVQIGPLAIRWYALAYMFGLLGAWFYARRLVDLSPSGLTRLDIDDFLVWATLGVVLGGRLGYILFYRPAFFLANPHEVFFLWHGGMSFHGGFLGVITAGWLFCRRKNISFIYLTDILACVTPIGLFLGRIANFINGELWGRTTDVAWGMVFPGAGPLPRHPSQLYQATLEGVVLFLFLLVVTAGGGLRRHGLLSGCFLLGYGLARMVGELFRQPDPQLGFLVAGITMGQLLSLPMVLGGLALIIQARRRPPAGRAS